MLSKLEEGRRNQLEVVALDELVPEDHLVGKIDQVIDFVYGLKLNRIRLSTFFLEKPSGSAHQHDSNQNSD
ncbi:hypothetical protein WAX46_04440 [Bacillus sp. FJAT-53060]|uniref:hypothetical protein n=1 Tax=Bacillus TaxID=1386 RepID=UPI001CFA110F|nr:hypothetical protein [Bacillus stratosphericus]